MKILPVFLLLFISILAKSQDDLPVLIVKKIIDGKVCDSCRVTRAGSLNLMEGAKQIPFLTLNAENQFLYIDSSLTQNFTAMPINNYYLAVAAFSLDFFSLHLSSQSRVRRNIQCSTSLQAPARKLVYHTG